MESTFLAGISLCDVRLLMGVTRFGCRTGVGRACSLTSYSGNASALADFKEQVFETFRWGHGYWDGWEVKKGRMVNSGSKGEIRSLA